MPQAAKASTTRRAALSVAAIFPALAAAPVQAAPASSVRALERRYRDLIAWANVATTDAECSRRIDLADEVEDQLRLLPCDSPDVAMVHLKLIARDAACGRRTNAAVDTGELAERVLGYLGEGW